jgi:hypothetical protein
MQNHAPPPRTGPRTEWKAVLDQARACELFAAARERMRPDPHARDAASCSYPVESIYLDTPGLDCFEAQGLVDLPKYRARRYGPGSETFLEEKLRRDLLVWKRRIPVPGRDVAWLLDVAADARAPGHAPAQRPSPDNAGHEPAPVDPLAPPGGSTGPCVVKDPGVDWFQRKLLMLQLRPTLLVAYERRALVGQQGERVTLDLALRATTLAGRADFAPAGVPRAIGDGAVLEIKYDGEATPLVAWLFDLVDRDPAPFSKYRLGILACGGQALRERSA